MKPQAKQRGSSPSGIEHAKVCTAWIKNQCQYGAQCKLWHTDACSHYVKGYCAAGGNCIFIHNTNGRDMSLCTKPDPRAKPAAPATPKAKATPAADAQASQQLNADGSQKW